MAERKRLGEMLVEAGVLTKGQVESGLRVQREWGCRLGEALIRTGAINEELLIKVLAKQLNIPAVDLEHINIPPELSTRIARDIQEKYSALPVAVTKQHGIDTLVVAMGDPTNLEAVEAIRFAAGGEVRICIALERKIREILFPPMEAIDFEADPEDTGEMVITRGAIEQEITTAVSPGQAAPQAAPQPAPQAAPQPVPQPPVPQPVPQAAPQPVPQPVPQAIPQAAPQAAPQQVAPQQVAALQQRIGQLLNQDARILLGALSTILIERGVLTVEELERFFQQHQS